MGNQAEKLLEIVSCDKYLARNIALGGPLGVCLDYYIIYPNCTSFDICTWNVKVRAIILVYNFTPFFIPNVDIM